MTYRGGADIRERTFKFAVRIVRFCHELDERRGVARTLGGQLLRSGTSIGANIEEAKAGQSRPDFISKCSIALKEARETHYWLRLVVASNVMPGIDAQSLLTESDALIRILTAIILTARRNQQ